MIRRCQHCGGEIPADRHYVAKSCSAECGRARRLERGAAKKRERYKVDAANRLRIKESNRAYREKIKSDAASRQKHLDYNRAYYHAHKARLNERAKARLRAKYRLKPDYREWRKAKYRAWYIAKRREAAETELFKFTMEPHNANHLD